MKKYKYYGQKRIENIQNKARKITKHIPKESRIFSTLDNEGNIINKTHTSKFYVNKLTEEYIEDKYASTIYNVERHSKIDRNIIEYEIYMTPLYKQKSAELNFYDKYKDEEYKGKKLKSYFNDLKNNRISQDEVTQILQDFKKSNEKYLRSGSS